VGNPRERATIMGSIDPKTEAHPLTAQAQGIKTRREPLSNRIPKGKGIPKTNPRGNISKKEITSLAAKGRPRRVKRMRERKV